MKKRIEKILAWAALVTLVILFFIMLWALIYGSVSYETRVFNHFNQIPL